MEMAPAADEDGVTSAMPVEQVPHQYRSQRQGSLSEAGSHQEGQGSLSEAGSHQEGQESLSEAGSHQEGVLAAGDCVSG